VAEVGLHRSLADAELVRDVLVGLAVGHQAQRRQLAWRELNVSHSLGQLGGGRRREVGLAGEYIVDARDQRVGRDVLEHVGLGAGLQGPGNIVVRVVGREHDDFGVRIALANLADRLDAFHDRHPQVEQRHVRVMPLEGLDRLEAVGGLGDHVQVRFLVDDVGDAGRSRA
jgi:hypothetical protein